MNTTYTPGRPTLSHRPRNEVSLSAMCTGLNFNRGDISCCYVKYDLLFCNKDDLEVFFQAYTKITMTVH